MKKVYWDSETFSQVSLNDHGAHIYVAHPSTGLFFFCYAVEGDEVQTWRPGDPIPTPFATPLQYMFIADNWEFERLVHEYILVKRYGFPTIPLENQDCAQRLALASAFPAELGLRCAALDLPYRKNEEARKAMLRLSRPQTAKKCKKPGDPSARERDLVLLRERCETDVMSTRATYNHPRLKPLLPEERQQLLLDARINARGIRANVAFLEAGRDLAISERNAVNTRFNERTAGVVTSVDQVKRIIQAINARGHDLTTLGKRSVSAALAREADAYVRELLELRQRGAFASTRKFKKLHSFADPDDHRIRGALRIYGAGPGRWSSLGAQLHNLPRNGAELPASLVEALIAGDRNELARWGNPLKIVSGISRAALCSMSGHILICVDLSSIESRITAWYAGEMWKLENFRQFDATGDKNLDLYRMLAHRMLKKNSPVSEITTAERQLGKNAELSCGFAGGEGGWRRIAGDDGRSSEEINAIIRMWREQNPAIRAFWYELARAARVAIRTGQPIIVAPAPRPPIICAFDGQDLCITLPSGRAINYPSAHLIPNAKFPDSPPDVEFSDNAKGQWKPMRAWMGVFVENVVQATARDLLAAALLRYDARGLPVVFHCHDEVVVEVPEGSISEQEVLSILLEAPPWAAGLPLGGKVHSGRLYLEAPATGEPPTPITPEEIVEHEVDAFVASTPPNPGIAKSADGDFLASLGDNLALLTDFVTLPMSSDGKVSCPFHDDPNPSCKIYPDHWRCFGCGENGSRLDWLMRVEAMTKAEAIGALQDWSGPVTQDRSDEVAERIAYALKLWAEAQPIAGTLAERYLAETRAIDVSKLPATIHDALRFHPHCAFGARARHTCLVALMRDPATDEAIGIHRIGLAPEDGKITKLDRKALGRMGVVKLWPVNGNGRLVVGEGVETTLAAATCITYRGAELLPAWSAVAKGGLGRLPVLPNVRELVLLVDNDINGEGQKAAQHCREIWNAAGRAVVPLIPKRKGWDFNDVILRGDRE